MAQLRHRKTELDAAGLRVVLVGMGTPEQTEAFRTKYRVPFPVICDPQKQLYRSYGLSKASVGQVASPGVFLKSLKALGKGHVIGVPQGDVMQLPGVFVIDREGRFCMQYYSKDAADHPSVDEIVRAAGQCA